MLKSATSDSGRTERGIRIEYSSVELYCEPTYISGISSIFVNVTVIREI